MKLRRVIYTSQATKQLSKRNLLDLLHEARAFNLEDGISGLLMHKEGYFLQVLEGNSKVIEDLLIRIHKDTRHNNFKIIQDSFVENRLFATWSMACTDFDDPTLSFIPGIRTDLNDLEVIDELLMNLPEISIFLQENLV